MRRIDSEEELREVFTEYSKKKDIEMIVEDFIDIGREMSILGVSTSEGVLSPGFFAAEKGGQKGRRGVAFTGEVLPTSYAQELIDNISRFISEMNYTGLFDIDLIEGKDGKLTAQQVREAHRLHWGDGAHEHITQPKLVYISNPTELGTIYSKAELEALRAACDDCNMYLFLDGARLGYGLMSEENDLTMEDVAKNCDVFYIGGTKVGALFGEAVVITNKALQEDFRYIIKQKGGMLAKGRLLGIQFLELFKDGLYFEVSAHAMRLAKLLKEGLEDAGYKFYANSPTNQLFVIVPNEKLEQIKEKYSYEYQMPYDETSSVVRFCTSWATKEENVLALLEDMR
jgi:threonine aldolase